MHYWKMYIDGASRNNPGLAGAGIFILKDGSPSIQQGYFLGTKTNNQAEYLALLLGLFFIKKDISLEDHLHILSDSQLLIRQLQGMYRIKHPDLQPLYRIAQMLLQGISYDLTHVLREENVQADLLANNGIDNKISVPSDFIAMLKSYEVTLY